VAAAPARAGEIACSTWLEGNPTPTGSPSGARWAGDRFFLTGERPMWSRDGVLWTPLDLPGRVDDVVWSGEEWLATDNRKLWTSCDGLNWTGTLVSSTGTQKRAAGHGEVTVVLNSDGSIFLRPRREAPFELVWSRPGTNGFEIQWAGDRFVARVGFNDTSEARFLTSRDGRAWQSWAAPPELWDYTWTGEKWIAVGLKGFVAVSADAENWTTVPFPNPINLTAIGFRPEGGFLVFGRGADSRQLAFRSEDGMSWRATGGAISDLYGVQDVLWNGFAWVAHVFRIYTHAYLDSFLWRSTDDGATWDFGVNVRHPALCGIASGNGVFVAAGSRTALTSRDGWVWNELGSRPEPSPHSLGIGGVVWDGTRFVAVGSSNVPSLAPPDPTAYLFESDDGVAWNMPAVEERRQFGGIAQGGGKTVLAGFTTDGVSGISSAFVRIRKPGEDWREVPFPAKVPLNHLTCFEKGCAALDWGHILYVKPDAESWTDVSQSVATGPWGIAAGAGRWVVVGQSAIVTSEDGIVWTTVWSGPTEASYPGSVAWSGDSFVAAGTNGLSLRSSDGLLWEPAGIPSGQNLSVVPWRRVDGTIGFLAQDFAGVVFEGDRFGRDWCVSASAPPSFPQYVADSPFARVTIALGRVETQLCEQLDGSVPPNPPVAGVVPIAAHSGGYEAGEWKSDLIVANVGGAAAPVEVQVAAIGIPFASASRRAWIAPPLRTGLLDDLVSNSFGESGSAAIRLRAGDSLRLDSRIRHETPLGPFVERIPLSRSDSAEGGEWLVPLPFSTESPSGGRRLNVGAASLGTVPSQLTIELLGGSGERLGRTLLDVPAGASARMDQIESSMGIPAGRVASVRLTSSPADSDLHPWLSLIDGATGDWLPLELAAPRSHLVFPVVARAIGVGGARWTTVLALAAGDEGGRGALVLRRTVEPGRVEELRFPFELAPGETRRWADVVGLFVPAPEGVLGNLEIEVDEGSVSASATTRNESGAGAFGQLLIPLAIPDGIDATHPLRLVGLSVRRGIRRANLGVANLGVTGARLTLRLFAGGGVPIREMTADLAPGETRQLPLAAPDGFDLLELSVEISPRDATTAEIAAWASMIEESSGDPLFLPAVR
jgi:hypothetical protein